MAEPWGRAPWHVAVAIPPAAPPPRVDVAVVGAGFAGLATAYELARRGVSVAVLEAERIGAGASGHSGAIALEGTAVGLLPDAERCLDSLARIVRDAGIECDLRLDGCWEVEHRPDGRWRDGDTGLAIADTVPGGTIDAGAILDGLARAVLAAGGTIHEQHRVVRVALGERVLRTVHGDVAAGRIVVATNAYLPTLLALGVDLRPALTLALATVPLDAATREAIGLRLPFYTVDLPYLWARTLADGRLVFGSGLVFPSGDDVRETRTDGEEGRAIFARLEARVRGLHPALAAVAVDRRWGGPISFVPSRAPIISPHPDDPQVVVTGGCAGHGVALSFRIGELVAEHVVDGRPLPAWGALEPVRPAHVPSA
jgi:glycine/D-amino acid oxidase-like deaminating enzyme